MKPPHHRLHLRSNGALQQKTFISWTETFVRQLVEKEVASSKGQAPKPGEQQITREHGFRPCMRHDEEPLPPFSLGTVAVGDALRAPNTDEGVQITEHPSDVYRSGTQADDAVAAALRADSESDSGSDDGSVVLEEMSQPPLAEDKAQHTSFVSADSAPEPGRSEFVSAKHVMASTQFQEVSSRSPETSVNTSRRRPLESIPPRASAWQHPEFSEHACDDFAETCGDAGARVQPPSPAHHSWKSHSYPSVDENGSSSHAAGVEDVETAKTEENQTSMCDSQTNSYDAALRMSNHLLEQQRLTRDAAQDSPHRRREIQRSRSTALQIVPATDCATSLIPLRVSIARTTSTPQPQWLQPAASRNVDGNADNAAEATAFQRPCHPRRTCTDGPSRFATRRSAETSAAGAQQREKDAVNRNKERTSSSKFVILSQALAPSEARPADAMRESATSARPNSERSRLVFLEPRAILHNPPLVNTEVPLSQTAKKERKRNSSRAKEVDRNPSRTGTSVNTAPALPFHKVPHLSRAAESHETTRSPILLQSDESTGPDSSHSVNHPQSAMTPSAAEGQSIPPPPTLRFDPSSITPISHLVSRSEAFLSARQGGPSLQVAAVRFHLLALVREVGPLEETAVKLHRKGSAAMDKVEMSFRSWLILQDGRDGALLKVILWGACAKDWAGSENQTYEDDRDREAESLTRSVDVTADSTMLTEGFTTMLQRNGRPSKRSKRRDTETSDRRTSSLGFRSALRAGDVVYLENVTLSAPAKQRAGGIDTSHLAGNDEALQGAASDRTDSSVELCWRWDIRSNRDRVRYSFDPEVAAFDRRCKEVWKCASWWRDATAVTGLNAYQRS